MENNAKILICTENAEERKGLVTGLQKHGFVPWMLSTRPTGPCV